MKRVDSLAMRYRYVKLRAMQPIKRIVRLISYRVRDGLYDWHLDCGHIITREGRATVPPALRCPQCEAIAETNARSGVIEREAG